MKLTSTPPPDRTDLTIGCRITISFIENSVIEAIIVAFLPNSNAILVEIQHDRPSDAPLEESSIKNIEAEDRLIYCKNYVWERLWWVYPLQIRSVIQRVTSLDSLLIDLSEEVRIESVMSRANSEIKEMEETLARFYKKKHEEVFEGSSWNCPKCNNNNAAGWKACDFCYTPKPVK